MKVFYLEGRGGVYIYHFIVLNLGGIYNIINKINPRTLYITSTQITNHKKITYIDDDDNISYPIPIIIDGQSNGNGLLNEWQTEICNYLSNKIKIISSVELKSEDTIISIYGVTLYKNCACDNPEIYFPFLRNLFLDNINKVDISIPRKRYYITRKYSNLIHNEKLRKFIRNEEDLILILNKYNFEYVILEQMSIKDKIILFNTADTILSTNSGCLVFSLVAGKDTKVIEIVNKSDGVEPVHYKLICNTLNIPYYRYSNINEDRLGNFDMNINDFDNYLKNIL